MKKKTCSLPGEKNRACIRIENGCFLKFQQDFDFFLNHFQKGFFIRQVFNISFNEIDFLTNPISPFCEKPEKCTKFKNTLLLKTLGFFRIYKKTLFVKRCKFK